MHDDDEIADVRAFNRFYTRQIGLLDEHFNDSPLSLPEGRVLYEIDAQGHTTGGELGRRLGMDRGYLSRILRKLTDAGLTAITPHPSDRRSNNLALTGDGDIMVERLNQKSSDAVAELLHPLAPEKRASLVEAMHTIRRLLGDETLASGPVILRPHRLGELGWLIHRQAVLYNQQFGWNREFEILIARIYHEFEEAPASPPKDLWVAEKDGSVVGSVFLTPHPKLEGTAQLRMLYVEPAARGLGIGTLLVAQCVDFARRSGYARLRLWTQSMLTSARKIYAAAGFELVESGPHHSFGKDLVGEYWELKL